MAAPLDITTGDIAIGRSEAGADTAANVTVSLGSKSAASGSSSIGGLGSVKKTLILIFIAAAAWILTKKGA